MRCLKTVQEFLTKLKEITMKVREQVLEIDIRGLSFDMDIKWRS